MDGFDRKTMSALTMKGSVGFEAAEMIGDDVGGEGADFFSRLESDRQVRECERRADACLHVHAKRAGCLTWPDEESTVQVTAVALRCLGVDLLVASVMEGMIRDQFTETVRIHPI